jgi:mono/diheme cytochrome c family protein
MRPRNTHLCLAAFVAVFSHGVPHAFADPGTLSVCIDTASATAARDEAVARQSASRESLTVKVHRFDSSDNDEGFGARDFRALLAKQCDIVMGYPVDRTGGTAPFGLSITAAYDQTGFVLATTAPLPDTGLGGLPADTLVAVTYGAVPNLYFVTYRALQSDIEMSEDATLHALTSGHAKAAMLWQPTMAAYLAAHQGAPIRVRPLVEPHARFDIVALYGPGGAAAAQHFQDGLAPPKASVPNRATPGRFGQRGAMPFLHLASAVSDGQDASAASVPALYTADQARAGERKYADDCAQCHGGALEGQSGPALKGKLFASVKTGFTVGDILNFMAVNMPATQPGSLSHDDYTDIMAYVLAQNGFPAGATALNFAGGAQSKVPLLYHGK